MLTVDQLKKSDNVRPVSREREASARAFVKFGLWLDQGVAIEPEPRRREDEDAEGR